VEKVCEKRTEEEREERVKGENRKGGSRKRTEVRANGRGGKLGAQV